MYQQYLTLVIVLLLVLPSFQEKYLTSEEYGRLKPGDIVEHLDKNMKVIDYEHILGTELLPDDITTPGPRIQPEDIQMVLDKLKELGISDTNKRPMLIDKDDTHQSQDTGKSQMTISPNFGVPSFEPSAYKREMELEMIANQRTTPRPRYSFDVVKKFLPKPFRIVS